LFAKIVYEKWRSGEVRPLCHILPQISLRAQLYRKHLGLAKVTSSFELLLQLPRFIWRPPKQSNQEYRLHSSVWA
jgi:hypothetical protein